MDLLRDVYCGSCLIYLPQGRGGGDRGKKSQDYCYAVKRGEEASIAKIAAHIGRRRNKNGIHGVLGEDAALVPMPRSGGGRPLRWTGTNSRSGHCEAFSIMATTTSSLTSASVKPSMASFDKSNLHSEVMILRITIRSDICNLIISMTSLLVMI